MLDRAVVWLAAAALCLGATTATATGVFESVSGKVTSAIGRSRPVEVRTGGQIREGSAITTGPGAHAVLRFDDGQVIALNQNTRFWVVGYSYDRAKPEGDRIVFALLKGAMRAITGLIGRRDPEAFVLQTPVAAIGIRGTDFMAVTGSLYISVGRGTVVATNDAGTKTWAAGKLGYIPNASTLPSAITAKQMPAGVAASFSQLGTIRVPGAGLPSSGSPGYRSPSPRLPEYRSP